MRGRIGLSHEWKRGEYVVSTDPPEVGPRGGARLPAGLVLGTRRAAGGGRALRRELVVLRALPGRRAGGLRPRRDRPGDLRLPGGSVRRGATPEAGSR